MRSLLFIIASSFFFTTGFSQNYLGYSKQYILKALKSQRKDMEGPTVVKAANDNFVFYIADDGRRIVYYYFKMVAITGTTGKQTQEEICIKYISKNRCYSFTECPELDEVTRSLDSHFTKQQDLIWVDFTKSVPHEWVIVRDANYFEIYVTELVK